MNAATVDKHATDMRLRLTVTPPPARTRLIRTVTAAVVIGPVVGFLAAAVLAIRYGVSPAAIVGFVIAYILTTLGVTLGYHRHFTHRSFRTSRAMQAVLIVLGSNALQGSLLYWVSTHRRHHQFSDTADDPHSPHSRGGELLGSLDGFWHGHIAWMFSRDITNALRFAPDILHDPFVFALQKRYGLYAIVGLALPAVIGGLWSGTSYGALEMFLWAGPVRLLVVHQASWAVGSISHLYGQRPFDTGDHSANNFWVAIFAFGEGLQNNHHAFPRSAYHAFQRWEPDLSGLVIAGLERARLIWDVNRPTLEQLATARRNNTLAKPAFAGEN
jgi:stearoyl-CoA desaturase (Delta-9 desaturase)